MSKDVPAVSWLLRKFSVKNVSEKTSGKDFAKTHKLLG